MLPIPPTGEPLAALRTHDAAYAIALESSLVACSSRRSLSASPILDRQRFSPSANCGSGAILILASFKLANRLAALVPARQRLSLMIGFTGRSFIRAALAWVPLQPGERPRNRVALSQRMMRLTSKFRTMAVAARARTKISFFSSGTRSIGPTPVQKI
jgi:hypothetical protein